MIRCYITDRQSLAGGTDELLRRVADAVRDGVDFVQIRENDLPARRLAEFIQQALEIADGTGTRILVNDRLDIALACGAHGVQLKSHSIPAKEWRRIVKSPFLLGVSCHTLEEVRSSAEADFVLFSPIFSSPGKGPPAGLAALATAARVCPVPVLALGGVTAENASACMAAGAAGVAGIRLFQPEMSRSVTLPSPPS